MMPPVTDLTLAHPLSSGYFLPYYFFMAYGLVRLEIFCLFPSTYYCYRYYLMGNSYHGVSDRWLCTPEDVGYVFDVTVKGYF